MRHGSIRPCVINDLRYDQRMYYLLFLRHAKPVCDPATRLQPAVVRVASADPRVGDYLEVFDRAQRRGSYAVCVRDQHYVMWVGAQRGGSVAEQTLYSRKN
jgi:hypothetical protein